MILRIGTWYSNANNALHKVLLESMNVLPRWSPRLGASFTSIRSMSVLLTFDDLADQAAVKAAIVSLEAAIATNPNDVGLYHDVNDATVPTVLSGHHLGNPGIDGLTRTGNVRLVSLEFVPTIGVEYATRRTARVTFEATYHSASLLSGTIIDLNQSVTYQGFGGSVQRWSEPITGDPVAVTMRAITPRIAIQRGSAVTWGAYSYATPLYSAQMQRDQGSSLTPGPVEYVDGSAVLYRSGWNYRFEGVETTPVVALWPKA